MNSVDLIAAIAATSSRTEKEALIRDAFVNGERRFFLGAQLAYDGLITFGVKAVAAITEDDGEGGDFSFADFIDLATKLKTRALTGHAARDAIRDAAGRCDPKVWNGFYRRILLKDFKAGMTGKTVNTVLNSLMDAHPSAADYLIPIFACQLAPSEAMTYEDLPALRGRWMVDVKYDGMRLPTFLNKELGEVQQYSRDGVLKMQFPEITAALQGVMDELPASVMIDGEIVTNSFRDLSTLINRKEGGNSAGARFAIFDIVPLADFLGGKCAMSQRMRNDVLAEMETGGLFQRHTNGLVFVHPKIEVDLDTEEGRETLSHFCEDVKTASRTDKKVEGIMVKDPEAPYECRRWAAWRKVKPNVDASLTAKEIARGEPGSKYAAVVGAILFEGVEDGKDISVSVGSGYSDEERALWIEHPELVLGMIGEIVGDSFSQGKKGEKDGKWSIRFPRFKGWRGTVPGEKL